MQTFFREVSFQIVVFSFRILQIKLSINYPKPELSSILYLSPTSQDRYLAFNCVGRQNFSFQRPYNVVHVLSISALLQPKIPPALSVQISIKIPRLIHSNFQSPLSCALTLPTSSFLQHLKIIHQQIIIQHQKTMEGVEFHLGIRMIVQKILGLLLVFPQEGLQCLLLLLD